MRRPISAIFLLWTGVGFGQEDKRQRIVEEQVEFIGDQLENTSVDLTTVFDDLYFFYEHPIDLNAATDDELRRLHLLSDLQIQSLIEYVDHYGELLTIYELGAVPSMDAATIERVVPFVTIRPSEDRHFRWSDVWKAGRHEVVLRHYRVLSSQKGYRPLPDSTMDNASNQRYLGNPDRYYFRYRMRYKNAISWGVTAEKDPGETFFTGTNRLGFDYYSGHLFFRKLWKFSQLAIGDYQIHVGQGLTLWSGFQMGKSAAIFNGSRYGYGLKPYTAVNESQFLRGVGVQTDVGRTVFTAFYSRKRIDAKMNPVDSTDGFANSFSSFQTSGYHRTISEVADKDAVGEQIAGGEWAYRSDHFRLGWAGVFTKYTAPLNAALKPYTVYQFNQRQLFTSGLNYRWFYRNLSLFGETAASDNGKWGTVNGIVWHADTRLELLLLMRGYDEQFQSLHANGFGESSKNAGEWGGYIGLRAHLSKRVTVQAYYDQFKHTHLKWLTDDLSEGREFFVQTDIAWNPRARYSLRLRDKMTERNEKAATTALKKQVPVRKTSLRLHSEQQVHPQLSLKSRIEWSRFSQGTTKSNGLLLFQDIVYQCKRLPFKLYHRIAVFDTDSYDARIYAYENDVLYAFNVPAYAHRGMRTYVMGQYKIGSSVVLWARWGGWFYQNLDTISSGLETIEGSRKMDVRLQLRIKL